MLRCATRKLPHVPIVTLDFLLPRFYATTTRRVPFVKPMQTRIPLVAAAPPAISLSPMLDENEAWLADEELGSLGPKTYRTYNEENALLKKALQDRDMRKALRSWSVLSEEHLLRFFGPPHHSQYSQLLADLMAKGPAQEPLSPEETKAMEEMMLVTAVGGFLDGLQARVQYLLQKQDADAVLHLFSRYMEMLEANGTRCSEEEDDLSAEGVESEEGDILGIATASHTRQIRPEPLLYAIAAYAMKDSFHEALHTGLRIRASLHTNAMENALSQLDLPPALSQKVVSYIRRIRLAKLFSRSTSFSRHISNIVRDRAGNVLKKTYDEAMDALRDPNSGIVLEPSAVSERSPILFPDFAWASFLSAFLQCRRLKFAEEIWDDMTKFGVKPNADVWAALLEGYAGLRLVEQARAAWSMMLKGGQAPTPFTYRALIYAEFHAGYPDEAMKRFEEFMRRVSNRAFDDEAAVLVVYNTVLHWLLFHGREAQATDLMERMKKKGPKPDIVSFNTLMRTYAKSGNLKALAATIQEMSTAALAGDVFTYSIVLTALAPVRQDAIQVVLDMMKKHGIKPNVAMWTTIITSLMKQQTEATFKAALDLLRKMEASDSSEMQPNAITYTSILSLLHRSSWLNQAVVEDITQSIAEKMMQRNLLNSRVTYNILIKACLENPSPEGLANALRYYGEMHSRQVFIANDTWYIMLSGLLHRKEWGLANEFVDEISRHEFVPPPALKELMYKVRNLHNKHVNLRSAS